MKRRELIRRGSFSCGGIIVALTMLWPSPHPEEAKGRPDTGIEIDALKARYAPPAGIPFPANNPFSKEKYFLGKKLFFDVALSGSRSMSCASCHKPDRNWTDGLARAVGHRGNELARKTPTLLNLAWGWSFFWDGRAKSLEEQALGPIQSEDEMNLPIPELVKRLSEDEEYRSLFARAFPGEKLQGETVGKAIATFVRTISSGDAPFDRWIAGDEQAISESAKRGFLVFNGAGACVKCHTGWGFTNFSFADTGLLSADRGRGKVLGDTDADFTFKTPTLRNVAERAPYMHDGSLPTLEAVVEHYAAGGTVRRETTKLFLEPLKLGARDKADLVAFLKTLTSEDDLIARPGPDGKNKGERHARNDTRR